MVNVKIGNFCSIADKCCIGGAKHPLTRVSSSPVFCEGPNVMMTNFSNFSNIETPCTIIKNDVWLGMGCYIKAGVTIHNGAVIGMGSIVTRDVPAYEIWAGNPARKIGQRFDPNISALLESTNWWDWDLQTLKKYSPVFDDVSSFLFEMKKEMF